MTDIPYQPSVYKFEVIRHMVHEPNLTIKSPHDMWAHFGFMEKYDREYMLRVDLNSANEILGYETVSIGTDSMANVGPKEVFRGALLTGASCIILAHNHPSGHIEPSREDRHIAGKLQLLGEELQLQLLDFVIIGRNGRHYSFSENEWTTPGIRARTITQAAKHIEDVETDIVQLEIYECGCGYHIGFDATFNEQVEVAVVKCPSCGMSVSGQHSLAGR